MIVYLSNNSFSPCNKSKRNCVLTAFGYWSCVFVATAVTWFTFSNHGTVFWTISFHRSEVYVFNVVVFQFQSWWCLIFWPVNFFESFINFCSQALVICYCFIECVLSCIVIGALDEAGISLDEIILATHLGIRQWIKRFLDNHNQERRAVVPLQQQSIARLNK